MVVPYAHKNAAGQALLAGLGYTVASSWYHGSTVAAAHTQPGVRTATVDDVNAMLEMGERKRKQYETLSPVFWRRAQTPRQTFTPYVSSQGASR